MRVTQEERELILYRRARDRRIKAAILRRRQGKS